MPKRVASADTHLRDLAPAQRRRSISAVASRLRRCVQFDRLGN